MKKALVLALAAVLVIVAFVAGYYAGRAKAESDWRLPPMVLSDADVSRMKVDGADPVPRAGSKVLRAMPLERSRVALRELTSNDAVKVAVGAIGRGDDGMELHLVVQNEAKCELKSVEGVAYGFRADGRSARLNKGGEHFVAFAKADLKVAPKGKDAVELPLKHPETASLAIAQVDRYACADGTTWARQ